MDFVMFLAEVIFFSYHRWLRKAVAAIWREK